MRKSVLAAVAASLCAVPAAAIPTPSAIYVLGDSLSDTGNTKAAFGAAGETLLVSNVLAGYGSNGRFSNGPVWHEYLADSLGVARAAPSRDGGTNYSHGGAEVNFLPGPTEGILLQHTKYQIDTAFSSDPDALYISWIGGNDVRSATGSADGPQQIDAALDDYATMLDTLVASGAEKFVIPNLPDIGRIPEFAGTPDSASASALTRQWNAGVGSIIADLTAETSAQIFALDVFGLFNDLLDTPGAYGFTNTSDECRGLFLGLFETSCRRADQYVFWDDKHPTTAAHRLLGDAAFDLLSEPSPLMAIGAASYRSASFAQMNLQAAGQVPAPAAFGLLGLGIAALSLRTAQANRRRPSSSLR